MKILVVVALVAIWAGVAWWLRHRAAAPLPGARVGDVLPVFRALDDNGTVVESTSLLGGPLLLKFFRGHW